MPKPKKICGANPTEAEVFAAFSQHYRANAAKAEEKEPFLITIFKWSLIFSGVIMLCFSLFYMGEVIYAFALEYNT